MVRVDLDTDGATKFTGIVLLLALLNDVLLSSPC